VAPPIPQHAEVVIVEQVAKRLPHTKVAEKDERPCTTSVPMFCKEPERVPTDSRNLESVGRKGPIHAMIQLDERAHKTDKARHERRGAAQNDGD